MQFPFKVYIVNHEGGHSTFLGQLVKMYDVLVPYPAKTDREAILAAAMQQAEEEGADALSIRGVATKLGIAPNALYRYFGSLSDLRGAVSEESQRRLLSAMQAGVGRKGPSEAIRAIAQAYLRFARESPHAFATTLHPSNVEGMPRRTVRAGGSSSPRWRGCTARSAPRRPPWPYGRFFTA
ncbi:TetR/AcrR family transcriptional regulator [Roseateles chitinivorans]|uniref:TetR/AcrR family transcriptional regulator n=1 Tax=Roseateles chitinivorans TaxID=2917965 RepID=UPI003D66EF1B